MGIDRPPYRGRGGVGDGIVNRRALALWPALDRRALTRCRHDPHRIAALVCRRTRLDYETVLALLSVPLLAPVEGATWFG
jgi:hypothetical protein